MEITATEAERLRAQNARTHVESLFLYQWYGYLARALRTQQRLGADEPDFDISWSFEEEGNRDAVAASLTEAGVDVSLLSHAEMIEEFARRLFGDQMAHYGIQLKFIWVHQGPNDAENASRIYFYKPGNLLRPC